MGLYQQKVAFKSNFENKLNLQKPVQLKFVTSNILKRVIKFLSMIHYELDHMLSN